MRWQVEIPVFDDRVEVLHWSMCCLRELAIACKCMKLISLIVRCVQSFGHQTIFSTIHRMVLLVSLCICVSAICSLVCLTTVFHSFWYVSNALCPLISIQVKC